MRRLLILLFVLIAAGQPPVALAEAGGPPGESDADLAERYAPVLYFHPDEVYRPQPAEVILEQARVRESRKLWFDVTVLLQADPSNLLDLETGERHFLDLWYGDSGRSAYTNYSAHQDRYRQTLSPDAGGPPPTVYAHVVRDDDDRTITIQYWALYYYNDWLNKHEGDWELIEVILSGSGDPLWVVLSQHHGGSRRPWPMAPVENGTHPAVFVARGSHANYFVGDEVYPHGRDIGRTRVEILDRTGTVARTVPAIVMLPDRDQLRANPDAWLGASWLAYRGRWGEGAIQGDFGGPLGPADSGERWEDPAGWGLDQPLDTDLWYAHRLKVEVVGGSAGHTEVHLSGAAGEPLPSAEELGSLALLHRDPPRQVVATIVAEPRDLVRISAAWPDPETATVAHLDWPKVALGESGRALLDLGPGARAVLTVEGGGPGGDDLLIDQARVTIVDATWDAPDLAWVGGALPAHRIGAGVLLALAAGIVPTLILVSALYLADWLEPEPVRIVAAVFVWGAVPAVLLALLAEILFRLPLDLIGYRPLEAAGLGWLSPFVQELLKGAAVVYVAWRFRDEFDGVLDGVVYGAAVGFGFAMTGMVISYLGWLVQWGYSGLSATWLAGGLVHGLNHALYTAIFGAGLGLAMDLPLPQDRWAVRIVAFVAAAVTHMAHSMLGSATVGLEVRGFLTTALGATVLVVVVVLSLRREQECVRVELASELPGDLYETMTDPGRRFRAERRALKHEGIAGMRRTRRVHRLCTKLAMQKARSRSRPDDEQRLKQVVASRSDLRLLIADGQGCTARPGC